MFTTRFDTMADPAAVLDAGALARLEELDPQQSSALLQRVLGTYAASLERARNDFTRARRPLQPDALRLLAHTLKSSSASVGALGLAALCAQLEQQIRLAQTDDIAPLLDALLAEMQRVAGAVQALRRA
jgi:hypothetical protein